MTESEFQSGVIDLAHMHGWRVAHFRPAMTSKGRWMTPVQADGAGFPDLVLARDGDVIFAELKAEKGRLSDNQKAWIDELLAPDKSHKVFVWKPSDLETIERILR